MNEIPVIQELSPAPQKKKSIFKKIVIGVSIIFLVVILLGVYVFYLWPDENLVNDPRLQLQKVSISDSDNAYFDLISAVKYYDSKTGFENNQKSLELFAQASTRQFYQPPNYMDPEKINFETVLPPLNDFKKLGVLNADYALSLSKLDTSENALKRALQGVRVGFLMENGQGSLLDYLVGQTIMKSNIQTIITIINKDNHIDNQLLTNVIRDLNNFSNSNSGLKKTFVLEHYSNINTLDVIGRDAAKWHRVSTMDPDGESENESETPLYLRILMRFYMRSHFHYQPNALKNTLSDMTIARLNNIQDTCVNITWKSLVENNVFTTNSFLKEMSTQNIVGKIIYGTTEASLDSVSYKKCFQDFNIISAQILAGLKMYKEKYKDLPVSLDILVPEYVTKIPIDPFDGKPIRYSREKKILYSVGKDLEDSGGGNDNTFTAADPSITIAF